MAGDTQLKTHQWIIVGIILIPVFLIVAFMFYGIGHLLPSIVITVPPVLLFWDIRDAIRGKSDRTYPEIFQRFLIMPFAITAWASPCIAVRVLWDTYFYKLNGSTSIEIFGITVPGFEMGDWFNYLAAACGLFFAVWFAAGSWKLAERRKKLMDETATSRIGSARQGVGEFIGVARHFDDKSVRQTRYSGNFSGNITGDPIIYWEKVDAIQKKQIHSMINNFYIEDGAGKMMIDPGNADFFDTGSMPAAREATNIIILERRVQSESVDGSELTTTISQKALFPGDTVYVFGTVQRNPDYKKSDAASLPFVIKPVGIKEKPGVINRILFNIDDYIVSHNPKHMFILSDTAESYVKELLDKKSRSAFLASMIWAVPALALLVVSIISQ